MPRRDKPSGTTRDATVSADVIPFPQRRTADNRLTSRDVLVLHEWLEGARAHGVVAYKIEEWEAGEDPRLFGSFAQIYRERQEWASWSIARSNGRYQTWENGYGRTLGVFDDLPAALAHLSAVAEAVKQSSTRGRHRRSRARKETPSGDAGATGCQHATG